MINTPMSFMMKWFARFILCALVAGCVTESDSPFLKEPTEADKQTAVSTYVQIAYRQIELKQYDRAMSALTEAMNIDDSSPLVQTALASTYQAQGEKQKAEKIYRQVIRRHEDFTDAFLRYGNFLYLEKRYEESCEMLERATRDDFYDRRSMAFYNLGTCQRELGKLEASEYSFERCLGLQPDNYLVLIELADLKFKRGAFPESKKQLDNYMKATREKKQQPSARALLLGIKLEREFGNKDAEASLALNLKNTYPYSAEYLEYKKMGEK